MTEDDWLTSADPARLFRWLELTRQDPRRVQLFVVGCCRRLWPLLGERSRAAVEAFEANADDPLPTAVPQSARRDAGTAYEDDRTAAHRAIHWALSGADPVEVIGVCAEAAGDAFAGDRVYTRDGVELRARGAAAEHRAQADLLRCVFGNPFPAARPRRGSG
jgi:hypothetical protein